MATVTAGFQILPDGKDMHTDGMIPEIIKVIKESGLNYHVGPMETVVEGNLHQVFELIQKAQQVGINTGASECMANIKVHYKPNGVTIADKWS
ncbi:thiamine-binding protein [Halalkalibacter alkalisediminis]|uniref:MTH1187 family thiamine-binding protein n=1 Tax=Halalkalibacter alkalisediminis TaxID=935616 RepID=A0ABV6NCU3_9BACI|nr:MTH1187 family thiamine-binding protein [Halalkalibacter alkalisediminis]